MSNPAQMFDHELNALKGWPSPYALDKKANVAAGEPKINGGSVMSLNSSGQFRLGLIASAMPIFALQNSTDFDVVGDTGNLVGGGNSTPLMSGLVATGGYELETTEYDALQTYNPNDKLTSPAPTEEGCGKVTLGTAFADTLCGVVSDGVKASTYSGSINMLRFWTYFLPVYVEASE